MKNIILLLLMNFYTFSYTQITYIPDSNFEQTLINKGFDSDNIINGQVLTSDIDTITHLTFNSFIAMSISDFTGIEDFNALETFISIENFLNFGSLYDSLDLSHNLNLTEVYLSRNMNLKKIKLPLNTKLVYILENSIQEINIQELTQLVSLTISYNREVMESIDLSNCNQLQYLNCINLGLQDLNLTNNTNLRSLYCGNDPEVDWSPIAYNEFTTINLSYNENLQNLMTVGLPLKKLNLTYNNDIENVYTYFCDSLSEIVFNNNDKLKYLDVNKCNLNNLNLVEIKNIEFLKLGLFLQLFDDEHSSNNIHHLNFEQNKKLKNLFVENIGLKTLNLRNDSNHIMLNVNMNNNLFLSCVTVDNELDANNVTGSYSNWEKYSNTHYSENCLTVSISKVELSNIKIYPNPTSDNINIFIDSHIIKEIKLFNSIGKKVNAVSIIKNNYAQINISHLPKGVYYLTLVNDKNNHFYKSIMLE